MAGGAKINKKQHKLLLSKTQKKIIIKAYFRSSYKIKNLPNKFNQYIFPEGIIILILKIFPYRVCVGDRSRIERGAAGCHAKFQSTIASFQSSAVGHNDHRCRVHGPATELPASEYFRYLLHNVTLRYLWYSHHSNYPSSF